MGGLLFRFATQRPLHNEAIWFMVSESTINISPDFKIPWISVSDLDHIWSYHFQFPNKFSPTNLPPNQVTLPSVLLPKTPNKNPSTWRPWLAVSALPARDFHTLADPSTHGSRSHPVGSWLVGIRALRWWEPFPTPLATPTWDDFGTKHKILGEISFFSVFF